jgi:hypothetical protein
MANQFQQRTGKRPATYDARDIKYADVRPTALALPNLPAHWGHATDFKDWLMLGNGPCDDGSITDESSYIYDGAGNCFWAGTDHVVMQSDKQADGSVAPFTCLSSLNDYAQYLGLSDASKIDANNDEGTDVREGLKRLQSVGVLDTEGNAHKIGVYIALELGNWAHLREASYIFEEVGLGFNFPESAMDQFNQGQVWSVVPGAQIDGGHYVPIAGHPSNGMWSVITWGKKQLATWSFISKYADEMWAYITMERYNSVTGETAEGYKDVDLEKFITLVGQGSVNS